MSGSGKAGNGRENNRRRHFRRRDNETRHEDGGPGRPSPQGGRSKNNNNQGNFASRTSGHDKKGKNHGKHQGGKSSRTSPLAPGRSTENYRGEKTSYIERPKWIPPKLNTDPLPVPDCPWCGKPIRDISQAISDKDTEMPVHFDCVAAKLAKTERLEKGDAITYIGGGRFGVVNFGDPKNNPRPPAGGNNGFKIKKVIEWENKDKRADWRYEICEHYSVT